MGNQDLSDYNAYLEDDFNPAVFANGLLVSTNDPDDFKIDLLSSLKRLKFDLRDINRKIKSKVENNYTDLLGEFDSLEKLSSTVSEVEPTVTQLNAANSRLDKSIVEPYTDCTQIHTAMKKIHQTSSLLRSSMFFLSLAARIEKIDKSDMELSRKPYKSLLLLSTLLYKLQKYVTENAYLKTIQLVRDYDEYKSKLISQCTSICTVNFKVIDADQDDKQSITNLMNSLMYISPESLYNSIQELMSAKTKVCVNLISRNLNNVNGLSRIFDRVSSQAKVLAILDDILRNNYWLPDESDTKQTMWDKVSENLDISVPLATVFWKDLATSLEPKFRAAISRGGPITKNLKLNSGSIKDSIVKSVLDSFGDGPSKKSKDCLEVTLMLNSTRFLDQH